MLALLLWPALKRAAPPPAQQQQYTAATQPNPGTPHRELCRHAGCLRHLLLRLRIQRCAAARLNQPGHIRLHTCGQGWVHMVWQVVGCVGLQP